MKFFKKETDFFEIFDSMGGNLVKASESLVDFFNDFSEMSKKIKHIKDLEHGNDLLTHEIIRRLNQTFITPIDREDIHTLASRMDDILDLMWGAAERSQIFNLKASTVEAAALSKTLAATIDLIHRAVNHLKKKEYTYIQDLCIQIHGLENQNDSKFREALGKLFEEIQDPVMIIKWKDIYQNLENATDRCEDVANTLESIVLKYG
jgi:predicted phosphate transport protein (TIGR00153 family)